MSSLKYLVGSNPYSEEKKKRLQSKLTLDTFSPIHPIKRRGQLGHQNSLSDDNLLGHSVMFLCRFARYRLSALDLTSNRRGVDLAAGVPDRLWSPLSSTDKSIQRRYESSTICSLKNYDSFCVTITTALTTWRMIITNPVIQLTRSEKCQTKFSQRSRIDSRT